MNFEEGNDYKFLIKDIITLPDDEYFLLEYNDGRKFLMRKRFYSDIYGLVTGKEILCRVDRINCNGKIFFEPHHPYYKVGMRDVFLITGLTERKFKKTGEFYKVLTATGPKGETAIIKDTDFADMLLFKPGERVEATIKKISRGELHLTDVSKA